jgi:hypothetical protein
VRSTLVSGYTLAPGRLSSFLTALLSCQLKLILLKCCLNKQRRKALFSAFRCGESNVNSSPKDVEEIRIFTDFPQSDSIEVFIKCLKIYTDQPEYKKFD